MRQIQTAVQKPFPTAQPIQKARLTKQQTTPTQIRRLVWWQATALWRYLRE